MGGGVSLSMMQTEDGASLTLCCSSSFSFSRRVLGEFWLLLLWFSSVPAAESLTLSSAIVVLLTNLSVLHVLVGLGGFGT